MTRRVYLDFNASTPIAPEVAEAIRPYLIDHYGNPSSQHWAGAPAKAAVERARGQVATLLGCRSEEVVFTSGGSESNTAIVAPLRFLETLGAKVTVLPVDRQGRVDPEDVRRMLTSRTLLVTIMHANNEVGTVQPIAEIAAIARGAGVLVHTARRLPRLPSARSSQPATFFGTALPDSKVDENDHHAQDIVRARGARAAHETLRISGRVGEVA